MVAFLSQRTWQFTYFSQQLGDSKWADKDVLDFGGNIGNILRDPNSTIDARRYWCIDVINEAIETGKRTYPEAHWLFYDRFCFFFNPYGVPRLRLPEIEQRFDYIVAYSVFTNTPPSDLIDLAGQLQTLLKRGGRLAFSFIDPHHRSWPDYDGNNLRWRLERDKTEDQTGFDIERLEQKARVANWCLLVNNRDVYVENERLAPCAPGLQKSCHAFYSEAYMKRLFPHATVLPPANNEMQHCCVIEASS